MLSSFKGKDGKISFKQKKILIPVIVVAVVIVGISAKAIMSKVAESKIDFYSTAYEGAKVASSTGYYRYSVELQSGDIKVDSNATSAKETIESAKNADTSEIEGKSILDSGARDQGKLSDSWTSADGIKTSKATDTNYEKFVFTGYTAKVQPLQTIGSVLYYSDANMKSGSQIFSYVVSDGVWFVNIGESKKALLSSGSEKLIRIGTALPDVSGYIKLDKDELVLDNYFNNKSISSIQDVDYTVERKEFLRMCNTALETLKSSLASVKPTVISKSDDRFYFNVSDKNLKDVASKLGALDNSMDSAYTSFVNKCKTDKVLDDTQLALLGEGKGAFVDYAKDKIAKFNDLTLQDNAVTSVNWIRLTGADGKKVFEVSSSSTWTSDSGVKYLLIIQGQHSQKSPKEYKISEPSAFMTYSQTKRNAESLVTSDLIKSFTKLLDSDGKPLQEKSMDKTTVKLK